MSRKAGRGPEDTRRAIVSAAAGLIGSRGIAVPISEIAAAAGVSKGGLLYHFPSKEDLFRGIVVDLIEQFRSRVEEAAAAEPEGTPGRLARAYIRTSFAHAANAAEISEFAGVAAQLALLPELEELADADARRWREDLHRDGLDPATVRLIVAASDGSASGPLWGAILHDDDRALLEADLIELTRRDGNS